MLLVARISPGRGAVLRDPAEEIVLEHVAGLFGIANRPESGQSNPVARSKVRQLCFLDIRIVAGHRFGVGGDLFGLPECFPGGDLQQDLIRQSSPQDKAWKLGRLRLGEERRC